MFKFVHSDAELALKMMRNVAVIKGQQVISRTYDFFTRHIDSQKSQPVISTRLRMAYLGAIRHDA
jgi:hypothetical protein